MEYARRSVVIYFSGNYDIYRGKFLNAVVKYMPGSVKGIFCYNPEDNLKVFCRENNLALYDNFNDFPADITEVLIGLLDFHTNADNMKVFSHLARFCFIQNIKLINGTFNFLSNYFPEYSAAIVDLRRNVHIKRPEYMTNKLASKKMQQRILTCGMDSNIGKMTAGLEVEKKLKASGYDVSFFPTGQIGMYLKGYGFCVDATIVDFTRGIIDEEVNKIDSDILIIEGQGSINHPEFFGAALSLLYGSQPQSLLFCGNFNFDSIRTCPNRPLPKVSEMISWIEKESKNYGHNAKVKALSMITQGLDEETARLKLNALEQEISLPVDDIVRLNEKNISFSLIN